MKLSSRVLLAITILTSVLFWAPMAGATGGGYTPGTEGAMGPSLPPPGLHYKQYNILLNADELTDTDGNDVDINFDLTVFAQAHRFAYFTQKKLFGADYGMSLIIPVVATDLEIGAFNSEDSDIGLGDIFIEPFVLSWHKERWDICFGTGFQFATGNWNNSGEPANGSVGSGGYHNVLVTTGATYYLDSAKSWSISALSRTVLYFGEQDETDYRPGDEFVVDWGIAKQFQASKEMLIRPALVGYGYWQLGDDKNRYDGGANSDKGSKYAIGAEVNLFWLPRLAQFNLRYLHDIKAEDETKAEVVVLSIVLSF
ncbi:SphA family protein [Desulfocicer niacini]